MLSRCRPPLTIRPKLPAKRFLPQSVILYHKTINLYQQLCDVNFEFVPPNQSIQDFYGELISLHPEIDDIPDDEVDNTDLCPWSIAFDHSPGHLIMCSVWSKAEYVENLIKSLAKKHGLAVYDPQSDKYILPDSVDETTEQKPWWKFW